MIQAVFYRYHAVYAVEADTVEEAKAILCGGEEDGSHSSVGVFVDGKPVLTDVWIEPHPPTEKEAREMLADYEKAQAA
jgi:hypothetical protein